MEKKAIVPVASVTDELIQGWKKQYGTIHKYATKDGKVAYFREPDIAIMDASAAISITSPIRSNQLLAKSCMLAGDECIVEEVAYVSGMSNKLSVIVGKVEGEFSTL